MMNIRILVPEERTSCHETSHFYSFRLWC